MIVYGIGLSPYVRKVLVYAAERDIPVELKPVGLGSADPDFLAASPFRKMPALRDGGFTVSDSSAIVAYLEAKHPDRPLIPAEPEARARTVWFDEYADTILIGAAAKIFFNRLVAPRFLGREGDEAAAARAEATELPPILDYLEGKLVRGPHLVGESLTLADIAVASPLVNLAHLGIGHAERHPRVAAFLAGMLARPSFATLLERERRFLAKSAA